MYRFGRVFITSFIYLLLAEPGFGQCHTYLGPYFWGGKLYGQPAGSIMSTGKNLADSLGASVIRFTLACNSDEAYLLSDTCITGSNLTTLASRPDFNAILTDPRYKTVIITAYDWASFGDCVNQNFLDTAFFTPANTDSIEHELRDFTNYLGQFSDKTFIITNWEGDNSIYCGSAYYDPNCATALESLLGFQKWINARSAGVRMANQPNVKFGIEFCNIHSLENLGKPTVLDNIIPNSDADYYLYSAYESINVSTAQTDSDITFIRRKLAGFGKDSMALLFGEMGFSQLSWGGPQDAALRLDSILKLVKQRDIPYGIVWTLVDTPYSFGLYDSAGNLSPIGLVLKNNICDTVTALCQPSYDTMHVSTCSNQAYPFNGKNYDIAGAYNDTLTNTGGCDSVVTLLLVVKEAPVVTLSWDSLFSVLTFLPYLGINGADTLACWAPNCPWTVFNIPLRGGNPPGGNYTGRGVLNNIFYGDSAFMIGNGNIDTITYTVVDSNGCIAIAKDSIGFLYCEGINDIYLNDQISIYPNPASTTLFIKPTGALPETIKLYSISGQLVYSGKFEPEMDVSNLPPGAYFMEIETSDAIARKMFVKM